MSLNDASVLLLMSFSLSPFLINHLHYNTLAFSSFLHLWLQHLIWNLFFSAALYPKYVLFLSRSNVCILISPFFLDSEVTGHIPTTTWSTSDSGAKPSSQ